MLNVQLHVVRITIIADNLTRRSGREQQPLKRIQILLIRLWKLAKDMRYLMNIKWHNCTGAFSFDDNTILDDHSIVLNFPGKSPFHLATKHRIGLNGNNQISFEEIVWNIITIIRPKVIDNTPLSQVGFSRCLPFNWHSGNQPPAWRSPSP